MYLLVALLKYSLFAEVGGTTYRLRPPMLGTSSGSNTASALDIRTREPARSPGTQNQSIEPCSLSNSKVLVVRPPMASHVPGGRLTYLMIRAAFTRVVPERLVRRTDSAAF